MKFNSSIAVSGLFLAFTISISKGLSFLFNSPSTIAILSAWFSVKALFLTLLITLLAQRQQ
jgi:hypothetical protein